MEATKQFDSALDTAVLSKLYLDALNMMHWDLVKSGLWQHVHMQWFVYLGFCVKSGDVMCNSMDCVMSLLFITTTFSLCSTSFEFTLLKWPCCNFVWHGLHMNSLFLTCEEYHKSSYFSINVFVYIVNFCFASFLNMILLYELWQVM